MEDYIGSPCPVCQQDFKAGDDIVVCPDCGTPYHRACWAKVGHCVHEAEHAAGFVWQPAARPADAAEAICPKCGAHNPAGAAFCNRCGTALAGARAQDGGPVYARGGAQGGAAYAPRQGAGAQGEPRMAAYAAGRDGGIYRREIGPDDPIDGIKARDWASFVGRSSPYYLMQFFRMSETHRRIGVSFSAFFFGPLYFFYRKMWREGFFFTALEALFGLPGILLLLHGAGVFTLGDGLLAGLLMAAQIGSVGGWALSIVMGLYAVYWYKQTATRQIRQIYEDVPEGPDRADALALRGGTSLLAVALYLLAAFAFGGVLASLLGPYLQTVLYGAAL